MVLQPARWSSGSDEVMETDKLKVDVKLGDSKFFLRKAYLGLVFGPEEVQGWNPSPHHNTG